MTAAPFANVKALRAFLHAHPRETFSTNELIDATGIKPTSLTSSFKTLQNADSRFSRPSLGFYRYDPPNSLKPAKFAAEPAIGEHSAGSLKIVGPVSNGDLMCQSESGDFYLARKL